MSFYNRVSFAGRVVGEPRVNVGDNYLFVSFGMTVPVGKSQREDKTWKTNTEIFNVSLSGDAAEYARECFEKGMLKKGTDVSVHGRLVIERYVDKNNNAVEKVAVKVSRMDESFDINLSSTDNQQGYNNGYNSHDNEQAGPQQMQGNFHQGNSQKDRDMADLMEQDRRRQEYQQYPNQQNHQKIGYNRTNRGCYENRSYGKQTMSDGEVIPF